MTERSESLPAQGRRFELIERIGSGSHGEVYLAEQFSESTGFHRRVALKLLRAGRADADVRRRIRDEARILGHIQHRGVVTAYDLVRLGDRWGVVMDYVPGADLLELLEAQSAVDAEIPLGAALAIGSEVAHAVHAAQTATDTSGNPLRVVHRDIKPSNVRLTPDGDVKVLDFGIARVDLSEREARTDTRIMGTLPYMAPERQNGGRGDEAGDVYAIAKLQLELLLTTETGRPPADREAHGHWLEEQLDDVEKRLGSSAATASLLLPLLVQSLAFDPAERPDAHELAVQLEELSRSVPGSTLREFSASFVPRIEQILDTRRVPATGIVVASSATWTDDPPLIHTPLPPALSDPPLEVPSPSDPTRLLPASTPAPPTSATFQPAPRRGNPALTLIGGGVLLALGAAFLSVYLVASRAPASTPAPSQPGVLVVEGPREPSPLAPVPAPAPEASPTPRPRPEPVAAPRPAPAPAPQPAPIEVPEPSPAPEPAPAEPIEPPPPEPVVPDEVGTAEAPEPEPTPVAPSVGGSWVGTATGRPVTFRLDDRGPGLVSGRVELVQGPTIRTIDVTGTIDPSGALDLTDARGQMHFRGTVDGGGIRGTYRAKAGGRWLEYSVDRN